MEATLGQTRKALVGAKESIYSNQYVLLGAVTLVAAAVRFYSLGEWSFWGDEIITVEKSLDIFDANLRNRPLTLLLTHVTLTAFGVSEWSARLVPALIGILSIPILYVPIKKMFDPAVGLVAGLLLAVSPWHLYWSQNARFYILLLLLYTLGLLAFYFGIEKDRPLYLVASLAFFLLAGYERTIAALFVPVVVSYVVLVKILPFEKPAGLNRRNLMLFFGPGVVAAMLLGTYYLFNPAQFVREFGWITWVNNNPFWLLAGIFYYVRVPVICLATVGAGYLLIKRNRASLLLGLSAVLPIAALLVLSFFTYSANRYVFISLTSWIILAGVAVVELFRNSRDNVKFLAVGVLLLLFLDSVGEDVLYYKYQHGNRDNWKAAFTLIQQQKAPEDMVISRIPALADYYLGERGEYIENVDVSQLNEYRGKIWFVEDMVVPSRTPHLLRWMQRNARIVSVLDVNANARNFTMRVYLYEPDTFQQSGASQ